MQDLLFLVLALALALSAPAASADRALYVSSGFPNSSNNVSALRISADGSLTPVLGSPFATGFAAVGIAITPDAQNVYTASISSNNVSGFAVAADGALSQLAGSPFAAGAGTGPFAAGPSPDGRFLYVANHLNGTIGVWAIDSTGGLSQITGSPFAIPMGQSSPFPIVVAPDGGHIYVPNENSNMVTAYAVATGGALSPIQTIPTGNNPFGAGITPDGKFFYVSNPGSGMCRLNPTATISAYSVDANGFLTPVPGSPFDIAPGNHPLNIAISPDGTHLFVTTCSTATISVFAIEANGALSQVPGSPFPTGGMSGRALALTPDGKRLYASNNGSNDVSGFDVGANAALTPIPGSPFPAGVTNPFLESIVITPNQPPTASFTVQTQPAGSPSSFNGSGSSDSDGSVVRYDWDFGDGSVLPNAGPTPQHTYAQPGTYTVTLTVTDNEGCSVERIFTGKATLCNGSPVARTSQQVVINTPPLANAGPDQTVECTSSSGASITLDGTASSDPDGDTLTFTWTGPFGTAIGPKPTVTLPLGTHAITLTVDDGKGGTASDTVIVKVVDTTPPNIKSLEAKPNILWPPNHKMVPVTVTVAASDICSSTAPICKIISVSSNEPIKVKRDDGSGDNTAPDWIITGDLTVKLRAERSGIGSGRVYTIKVRCTDASGNSSVKNVTVSVPPHGHHHHHLA